VRGGPTGPTAHRYHAGIATGHSLWQIDAMIEIDGSYGEGGGQILRTSLSLSALLRRPFRITNIRRARRKPGLMPQHLAAVRALTEITDATVSGDGIASTVLQFDPGETRAGRFAFDITTAGSLSLLLQAVLPPLAFAQGPSQISLTGGTHVPFSPTFHYLAEVFCPLLQRLGVTVSMNLERYGFYPKGGGRVSVQVGSGAAIQTAHLTEAGELRSIQGISTVTNLPLHIAARQRRACLQSLSRQGYGAHMQSNAVGGPGAGSFVFLRIETDTALAGFSALGARGKRAEAVGMEAAEQAIRHLATGACLDPHLADQIALYLAVAPGASVFTTSRISEHLLTNLWTIQRFVGLEYTVDGKKDRPGTIALKPAPAK
jgi:RNA 3'-terminal phosphate cyclase (ATP)